MNFGTLKSRLLAQIGRAPSDLCYEMVTADINNKLRLAEMQAVTTFSLVAEHTLPDDFLEAVSLYTEENGCRTSIPSVEPSTFDAEYSTSAYPGMYSISDGVMRINGTLGSSALTLRYYQKVADFGGDDETNAVLTNQPAIYIYGVLAHHATLIRNPEALSLHFPAYEKVMKTAMDGDRARRTGGMISGPKKRGMAP